MFTGLVQGKGKVQKLEKNLHKTILVITFSNYKKMILGSSLCISGVCLTLTKQKKNQLWFDIMEETLHKTTLGSLKKGDTVNVETSLRIGDELGGHFVYGHVDGVGKVKKIQKKNDTVLLTVKIPQKLRSYFVPQGSITINGVSLTIAKLSKKEFSVSLVSFTLHNTNLSDLQPGDDVNIECDMLAKYVAAIQ